MHYRYILYVLHRKVCIMDYYGMSDKAILVEIGTRLKSKRLRKDFSQQELADRAGLSRNTISDMERGGSATFQNFIRTLRALDALDELDHFLPEPGISPVQMIRMKGKARMRASGKKKKTYKQVS